MAQLTFKDRVAVVTGAGNGLGKIYAVELAKRGARVVVNDLGGSFKGDGKDQSAADRVVDEIKKAGGIAVANYDSVTEGEKIIKTAIDNFGRIDILINNAGILRDVSFVKMKPEEWDKIYQVHLRAVFITTRAAWPYMRDQKYGRIIMTTSAAGLYGNFGQANYSAAKLGLVGLANTLALEGKKFNIQVNTIAPLAASRLTETVLPPDMLQALKPEFVWPLVGVLCHDSCKESGSVFELGAGWVSKVRWQRSQGVTFPLNGSTEQTISPETLKARWSEVNDFTKHQYPKTPQDSFAVLMENISQSQESQPKSGKKIRSAL